MKQILLKFDQSAYLGASSYSANVRLVNCFSMPDKSGRTESVLHPFPGSSLVSSVSPVVGSGCRGAFRSSTGPESSGYLSTLYFVFGSTVFRYNRVGQAVAVGSFNSSNVAGSCTFCENQAQTSSDVWVYVCDQQTIYKFLAKSEDADIATTWQEIGFIPHQPDGDIQVTPAYISWSDYRLIMSAKDSNAWFYSDTGTDTFRETNTYFGESSADKTIRAFAFGGNIWSFGAYSYDIFTRTGNRQNPYSNPRSQSGKIGLASAESLASVDDLMFWLGAGESAGSGVYMADRNANIKRVSDAGIENIIRAWTYQGAAYGMAYVDRGQTFYCLTSRYDGSTVCYNATTGKWNTASSSGNGTESFWDVAHPVMGYGVDDVLFGSVSENKIAKFDRSTMTDYKAQPVTRIWQSPVYTMDLKRFRVLRIVIDADVGTSESYTREAKLWVQISADGGRTWRERVERGLGTRGKYGRQIVLNGGGLPRDLVMRIGTSDPVPLLMYQIRLDVEEFAR